MPLEALIKIVPRQYTSMVRLNAQYSLFSLTAPQTINVGRRETIVIYTGIKLVAPRNTKWTSSLSLDSSFDPYDVTLKNNMIDSGKEIIVEFDSGDKEFTIRQGQFLVNFVPFKIVTFGQNALPESDGTEQMQDDSVVIV